jgi:putative mRNA 3-end processing factor
MSFQLSLLEAGDRSDAAPLVVQTERGLYCPAGDFYVDPCRPVQTAVVTHAHGDHLRSGHARYLVASAGLPVVRHRLGSGHHLTALDYGSACSLRDTRVSLHPAGHILGSAQVRIEHGGRVWVVSGDYKRQADPTCAPLEPLACDVFVSESTFGSPVFRWSATAEVVDGILGWWRANRERGVTSVLFCYALGKAQRVLAELAPYTQEPVYVHGAIAALCAAYQRAGVVLPPTQVPRELRSPAYRGALVIAPPNAARTSWMNRFGEHATALCSGWALHPSDRLTRRYDRAFALSDHADWPGLLSTCAETGARRVLFMHGESAGLSAELRTRGIQAGALADQYSI